jgi:hypothetical protein
MIPIGDRYAEGFRRKYGKVLMYWRVWTKEVRVGEFLLVGVNIRRLRVQTEIL